MAFPLPILLAGGAVLILGSKKKRVRGRKKSLAGQPCDVATRPPSGMVCRDGIFHPEIFDESILEVDDQPTGEGVGDFEMKEEDVSLDEGEEASQVTLGPSEESDLGQMCEEFFQAIHVDPTNAGELPINKVAVEQTAIPAMKATMLGIHQNLGGQTIDAETVGPVMIVSALNELIPACDWEYDNVNYDFTYGSGSTIESAIGRDVIYGLMSLSVQLIEDFNAEKGPPTPGPIAAESQKPKAGFQGA